MNKLNSTYDKNRLIYLDNCKLFLMLLVITYHSAHAYSNLSWIFKDKNCISGISNYLSINKAFFMGLFFFISGFFATKSVIKYNTKDFIKEKAKHLLLPVLFLSFIAVPLYFYISYLNKYNYISFLKYYIIKYILKGHLSYEHGWFLVVLFLFLVVYKIFYNLFINTNKVKNININLNLITLLFSAILISALTYIIRIYYNENEWIKLLGLIGFEPVHIMQYIIMFTLGIIAYKNNWLKHLNNYIGISSLVIGLSLILLFCTKGYLGIFYINLINKHWCFIESLICVYFSIGLIYVFKRFFNKENKISKEMVKSYYGAYIIHNNFVVLFQILVSKFNISVYVKYAIVSILAIIVSFTISYIYKESKKLFNIKILKSLD